MNLHDPMSEAIGTPPDERRWTDLCDWNAVPAQGGKYLAIRDFTLAIFRVGPGEARVIDDTCPHAGGSLSAGRVQDGSIVYCPWHHWPFRLEDGRCADNPNHCVRTYPARVVNGKVQAQLPRSR